jgi:hypothetical protein
VYTNLGFLTLLFHICVWPVAISRVLKVFQALSPQSNLDTECEIVFVCRRVELLLEDCDQISCGYIQYYFVINFVLALLVFTIEFDYNDIRAHSQPKCSSLDLVQLHCCLLAEP